MIASGNSQAGVEAVIDRDLASALLAVGLGADVLALATDAVAVCTAWGARPARRGPGDTRVIAYAALRRRSDGAVGTQIRASGPEVELH